MDYVETFIEVAPDCPATQGLIPPSKVNKKTIAQLQFELLSAQPYVFTQKELLFEVYYLHKNLQASPETKEDLKKAFFTKQYPCMRASPLAKRYGWGVHFNTEGKMALCALESNAYKQYTKNQALTVLSALRNRRTLSS